MDGLHLRRVGWAAFNLKAFESALEIPLSYGSLRGSGRRGGLGTGRLYLLDIIYNHCFGNDVDLHVFEENHIDMAIYHE